MWKKVASGLFLCFILVSQISYFPPRGGGGGGGYGAGYGLLVNGSNLDVNTAVIPSNALLQTTSAQICRSTTGNDTYTCTLNPVATSLGNGTTGSLCVVLNADTSNTGASTLNVDTLGAKSLQNADGTDATITANKPSSFCYDGTQFVLQGGGGSSGGGSTITRGVYASAPACTVSGDAGKMYWTSDAALDGYCAGVSGWIWKYKAVDVIPRALSYFGTTYNQGANYSEVDLVAAFRMKVDNAGTPQVRGRLRAIPTAPYTVYACMEPGNLTRITTAAGIIITNGTSTAALNRMAGQQAMNSFGNNVGPGHSAINLGAANGGSLTNLAVNYKMGGGGHVCYAFTDDTTTRKFAYSDDGINWNLIYSEGNTTGFTATHWGVAGFNGADEAGVILTVRSAGEIASAVTVQP